MTEKDWITKENIHELNTAFFFGQDYFKTDRPEGDQNASTAQTLYIQQQLMDIREEMDMNVESEYGVDFFSEEAQKSMTKYDQLLGQMKFLEI